MGIAGGCLILGTPEAYNGVKCEGMRYEAFTVDPGLDRFANYRV